MQHHESKWHAEKLIHCLKCQGHNEGLYHQNMIISIISSKLLVGLQPNLITLWVIRIQHHKPECPLEKSDYCNCVEGQSHSEGSECQWMFVWVRSSELQNILLPNLVWWCSIISQSVMWRKKNCLLSSRSRSQRGLIWSKYDFFHYICWTVDLSATSHGLIINHHKPECFMKTLDYCIQSQGPDDIFKTAKHLVTILGIVMHHHELGCCAKRLVCYFQGQGYSKGSYDQNMTVSTISSELLVL